LIGAVSSCSKRGGTFVYVQKKELNKYRWFGVYSMNNTEGIGGKCKYGKLIEQLLSTFSAPSLG
jgi:hypothetical protein